MPDDRLDDLLGSAFHADPVSIRYGTVPLSACWPPDAYWPPDASAPIGPQAASLAVGEGPASARLAREFTSKYLLDRGLSHLVDDAVTVACELVTNALTHAALPPSRPSSAAAPVRVILIYHRNRLTIMVTDPDSTPPALPPPDRLALFAESGRGLHIVQALSSRCAWTPLTSGGKAVWALINDRATHDLKADTNQCPSC